MTDAFFHARQIRKPEDVKWHLADPEKHWKKGFSAYELAHSWVKAEGIPRPVCSVLHQAAEFRRMELIEGFFERKTDLRTRGRPSQTDLLALLGDGRGFMVLGIEGKVNESFGLRISDWLVDASVHKRRRLSALCKTLGLSETEVENLRYQLLHRTAAAIYEAQRYKVCRAVMLVHSFSESHSGFDDFQAFANAIQTPVSDMNKLSRTVEAENVTLRLGWVADRASQ